MLRNKAGLAGMVILVLCAGVALSATWISPHDPSRLNLKERLKEPSASHIAGTDRFGRDILSRIIWGSRISLQVGMISVCLGILVGLPLGVCSGLFGGMTDRLIGRTLDIMLSFPSMVLAIAVVGMVGTGITGVSLAIGVSLAPRFARLVRAETLVVKEEDFVMAAKSMAAHWLRVALVHILPQALPTLVVQATFQFANAMMSDAALSFLGLGVAPPTPTWGGMVRDGLSLIDTAWWVSALPSAAIMIVVLSLNLVGDAMRDALDPMLARARGSAGRKHP